MIDTDAIIRELYPPDSKAYTILADHGRRVAKKALEAARCVSHLNPDLTFIEEAAYLHDIGIVYTHSPSLSCHGNHHYLFHGVMGREFLDKKGLYAHGLVAERHTLTGLTKETIIQKNLGLPPRDMVPQSLEEIIVCYADKFFSKSHKTHGVAKPLDLILSNLAHYGEEHVTTFKCWHKTFGASSHGA